MAGLADILAQAKAHRAAGRPKAAVELLRRALARHSADPDLSHLLGAALAETGQFDQAIYYAQRAAAAGPGVARYHASLGGVFMAAQKYPEAEAALREAVRLDPSHAQTPTVLALALIGQNEHEKAAEVLAEAIRRHPARQDLRSTHALVLITMGRAEEAVAALKEAMAVGPKTIEIAGKLAQEMNYIMAPPGEVFDVHKAFGELAAVPGPTRPWPPRWPSAAITAEPDRKLRIGYLSPDFCSHSVGFFIEPVLRHHDRSAFGVHCYAKVAEPDAVTARMKGYADLWRDVGPLSHAQLAERIADDGVDILVDLAGITGRSLVRVMTLTPAPVQVTYLGYPNTTGIPAINYRLVDWTTDPPGAERWAVEELVRLEGCFLCYRPPDEAPSLDEPIVPPPSQRRGESAGVGAGTVTFGSFNAADKVGTTVAAMWARVLAAVPGSRLLLKNPSLSVPSVKRRFQETFAACGVEPARLELVGTIKSKREHFLYYERVDIALDTFPYHGTTTTCEALWMGVPVVTLAGGVHASRVGVSLLTAVGLSEFIAPTPDEYVRIAADLARGPARLADLRSGLRRRLAESPLCDGPGFTRKIEAAYRRMWRKWCDR